MKKLIAMMMLLLPMLAMGQIKKQVYGVNLGEDSMAEAAQVLSRKSSFVFPASNGSSILFTADNFSGLNWSGRIFSQNGKANEMVLHYENSSSEILDKEFHRLTKSLKDKYSKYYLPDKSNDKHHYYWDGVIDLSIYYNSGGLVLSYRYKGVDSDL